MMRFGVPGRQPNIQTFNFYKIRWFIQGHQIPSIYYYKWLYYLIFANIGLQVGLQSFIYQLKGVNLSMIDPSKFYKNIILSLERPFVENDSEKAIWQRVTFEIASKLKIQISFDTRFADALKEYFKDINLKFQGTEIFIKKIKFVQFVNHLFYRQNFISRRQYQRLKEQIYKIIYSPCNEWQENLSYIKQADSLREFREDFLYRYCKLSEEQYQALLDQVDTYEGKQKLKAQYQKFFTHLIEVGTSLKIANFVETCWSQWQSKSEMLSCELILTLQKYLGSEIGRTTDEVAINNALINIAQEYSFQNDCEVKQKLQAEVKLIQKALQKFSGLNILKDKKIELRLGKFGSIVSGFAGIDADLDLTILTNCYVNELQFLKVVYQFLKKQYQEGDRRSSGRRVIPQLIATAKTPLISVTISERGQKEIKIDIIVNNILGIVNSKFLSVYAGVKWIRNLGILVKLWGKATNLIGKTVLSSYAMILMLIHYLIKSKKVNAILDARGRKPDTPHFKFKRMKLNEIEQFNVYYNYKNKSQDVAANERVNYYEILLGFMKYYGVELERDNELNVSRIITVDQSTDCQIDRETAITIKDPFDKPHNPGRLKRESLPFMITRFKEAHETLTSGKIERIKDLFLKY